MSVGIVGYGVYVPWRFIDPARIAPQARRLGLLKKALADWDEDSITMAVEAGRSALLQTNVSVDDVGAVYIGSESPPYAVNPSSTVVADILGMGDAYRAADLQFACKAATAGLQMAAAEVAQQHIPYGLVIGTDTSQARPGDPLELSAGAAAVAVLVGKKNVIAKIEGTLSVSSDTPDFWRREHERYPSHGGRFTGKPAYFQHVITAAKRLMEKLRVKPEDFAYVVFHMPNGVFPVTAAQILGFSEKQYLPGLTVKEVGNPYSASALLGLVAIMERAKPKQRILMVAYGSGAGADAVAFKTTPSISFLKRGSLQKMFLKRKEVDIETYLRNRRIQ